MNVIEKAAGFVMGKGTKVSTGISNRRLDICMDCNQFFSATKQCKICKCFVRAKAEYSGEICPLNKWWNIDFYVLNQLTKKLNE